MMMKIYLLMTYARFILDGNDINNTVLANGFVGVQSEVVSRFRHRRTYTH
jgi:hypothetical protein